LQNFLQLIRIKNQKIFDHTKMRLTHSLKDFKQFINSLTSNKYDLIKLYLWNAVFALIRMFVFYDVERRWIWTNVLSFILDLIWFITLSILGFLYSKKFKIQSGIIKKWENQNDV
jgi:hypothetical protein